MRSLVKMGLLVFLLLVLIPVCATAGDIYHSHSEYCECAVFRGSVHDHTIYVYIDYDEDEHRVREYTCRRCETCSKIMDERNYGHDIGFQSHYYVNGVCACGRKEQFLSVNISSIYAPAAGTSVTINVSSNVEWVCYSSDEKWITTGKGNYGTGDGSFTITVQENNTGASRKGNISIVAEGYKTITIPVTQEAPACQHTNLMGRYDPKKPIYSIVDETYHDVSYDCTVYCEDCGAKTGETVRYKESTVRHTFTNDVCVCGYQRRSVCTHTSYTDIYDQSGETKITNITATTHTIQHPYKRTCNNCGHVQNILSDPQTVAHSFGSNNKCSICGYDRTASCTHQYAVHMDEPVWNSGVYTNNGTYHTRVSCDYKQYCKICGAQGPNLTVSENITGAHWYVDDTYEYDDEMHWHKYLTCRGCGYERDRGYAYHTFVNGKCTCCGYAEQYALAVKIDGAWNQSDTVVVDKNTYFGVGIINGATGNAFSPDNVTFKIERSKESVLSKQDEYTYFASNYGSCVLSLYKDNKLMDTLTVTVGHDDVVAKLNEFLSHCANVSYWADKTQERSLYESVTLDLFTKGTGALTDGVKRIAGYQGIIQDEEMMQIVESMVLAEMDEVEYLTNTAFASLAELSKDASDVADLCKKYSIDPLSDNWLTELGEAIATNEEGHYRSGELVEKVIKIRKAHDVYATGTEALGGVASFVEWLNDMQDAKRTYEMRSYMQAEAKEHLDALAAGFSDPHMVEVIRDYQKKVENALANLVIEQTISTLEGGDDIYGSYCKVIECLKDAGVFKHLPKNVSAYTKAEKAFKDFKIGGKFKVEDIMDGMEIFDTIATVEGLLGNGKGLVDSLDILEREHMALKKEVEALVKELNTYYTYDAVTGTYTFTLTKNQITLRIKALGSLCMATLNSLEDTTNILHKMYTEEMIGKLTKLIDRDGYEQAIKDIPEILKEIEEYKETTQALLIELQTMIEKYPNFPE